MALFYIDPRDPNRPTTYLDETPLVTTSSAGAVVMASTRGCTDTFNTMMAFVAACNHEPEPEPIIPEPIPTWLTKQLWQAERRESERVYLQQIAKAERHRPKKGKFRKVNRRKLRR